MTQSGKRRIERWVSIIKKLINCSRLARIRPILQGAAICRLNEKAAGREGFIIPRAPRFIHLRRPAQYVGASLAGNDSFEPSSTDLSPPLGSWLTAPAGTPPGIGWATSFPDSSWRSTYCRIPPWR
jgi:hypothetical protein